MKFLIDECLSPELATEARRRGFLESVHVTWRGLGSSEDWVTFSGQVYYDVEKTL